MVVLVVVVVEVEKREWSFSSLKYYMYLHASLHQASAEPLPHARLTSIALFFLAWKEQWKTHSALA